MNFGPESLLLLGILVLDAVWGDPVYPLHPVRLIGLLCNRMEKILRRLEIPGRLGGMILSLSIVLGVFLIWTGIYLVFISIHDYLGFLWQLYTGWSMLAGRDLIEHARMVWNAMENSDLEQCRLMTGRMVGRDTSNMNFSASGRAVIESLSENLNDGVIAPLFYFIVANQAGRSYGGSQSWARRSMAATANLGSMA